MKNKCNSNEEQIGNSNEEQNDNSNEEQNDNSNEEQNGNSNEEQIGNSSEEQNDLTNTDNFTNTNNATNTDNLSSTDDFMSYLLNSRRNRRFSYYPVSSQIQRSQTMPPRLRNIISELLGSSRVLDTPNMTISYEGYQSPQFLRDFINSTLGDTQPERSNGLTDSELLNYSRIVNFNEINNVTMTSCPVCQIDFSPEDENTRSK